MQSNLTKKIEKIFTAFNNMDKFPKAIIKHGLKFFLFLFAVGTLIITYNHTMMDYSSYLEFIGTSVVKSSFIILAEVVIGGLVIDFVFKKN